MPEYPHELPTIKLADGKVRQLLITIRIAKKICTKLGEKDFANAVKMLGGNPLLSSLFLEAMLVPLADEPPLSEDQIDDLVQHDLQTIMETILDAVWFFFQGDRPRPKTIEEVGVAIETPIIN